MDQLSVGDTAPDFELPVGPGESVRLSDKLAHHEHAVIAFFPAAWSPVCGDAVLVLEAVADELRRLGACIVGICPDNFWSTRAWAEHLGLSFPLASDFEPKGKVARSYGVFHDEGICQPAQFIVDEARRVEMAHIVPLGKSPGAHMILKRLEELRSRG